VHWYSHLRVIDRRNSSIEFDVSCISFKIGRRCNKKIIDEEPGRKNDTRRVGRAYLAVRIN
jgi:hypothetical protein